jgi:hypothetical protein
LSQVLCETSSYDEMKYVHLAEWLGTQIKTIFQKKSKWFFFKLFSK